MALGGRGDEQLDVLGARGAAKAAAEDKLDSVADVQLGPAFPDVLLSVRDEIAALVVNLDRAGRVRIDGKKFGEAGENDGGAHDAVLAGGVHGRHLAEAAQVHVKAKDAIG